VKCKEKMKNFHIRAVGQSFVDANALKINGLQLENNKKSKSKK